MDTAVLLLPFSLCSPVVELSLVPPLECQTTGDQVPCTGKSGSALEPPLLLVTMSDIGPPLTCSVTQLLTRTTGWPMVLLNPETDGREERSWVRPQPIDMFTKTSTQIYLNI